MKKYLALLIITLLTLIIISCVPSATTHYYTPKGYKNCSSNWDCDRRMGEYCGFVGIDTYAVCRQ